MFQFFTGWAIASTIFYLLTILFLLWMAYRFVIAHESIADSLRRIERRDTGSDPDKTDRYNFGKR